MKTKLFTAVILTATLLTSFSVTSPVLAQAIKSDFLDFPISEEAVFCDSTSPKAKFNKKPIIGTTATCYLSSKYMPYKGNSVPTQPIRLKIGSAKQSNVCKQDKFDDASKAGTSDSYRLFYTCENTTVAGRPGNQTLTLGGQKIGKILVQNSIPTFKIDKIYHNQDGENGPTDLTDPKHKYVIEYSYTNFEIGQNGYKIKIFPSKSKPKKLLINISEYGLNLQAFTKAELSDSSNKVCAVVFRYNQMLKKTKSCAELPPNTKLKVATIDDVSKALSCPQFLNVSKGVDKFSCKYDLPSDLVAKDPNYFDFGGGQPLFLTPDNTWDLQIKDSRDMPLSLTQTCGKEAQNLVCKLDLDYLKSLNLQYPIKASVGVGVRRGDVTGSNASSKTIELR